MKIAMLATIVLSAALCFRVSASAGGMYTPEVTDLQLKDAITNTKRPFVLINERELEVLRSALGKGTWKTKLYQHQLRQGEAEYMGAGLLQAANKWLREDITIPEYGGHGHHFYCDCGTQLILPADKEPKPSYKCPACGKTFSGERYDAAVRCFRHHEIADGAQVLAIVYGIEHNKAYSDKAAEILRKYAAAYPGPHTNPTTGGIIYQSLNEAMWVIPLAQAYDLIYDSGSLTQDDRRLIEDKLFRPIAKGLITCGVGGNWGTWHFSAVGVIGLTIRDQAMVRYAINNFKSQMRDYLQDDGLWPESVHTYHFFALQALIKLSESAYRAGIDIYNWESKPGKSLKLMFSAPLQYTYPNFQLPTINDGWWNSPLPLDLYEISRLRWNDPMFEWTLQSAYGRIRSQKYDDSGSLSYLAGASVYRFLFGHELQPAPSDAVGFTSTNFDNFGLCTLRNGIDSMVTFHYGRFLGHGHLDKMSFTLFANGSLLVPDFGTPGYGSKILHWYQSTAGHNTVVVDGKNQARSKELELTAFYSGVFTQFAEAKTDDIYPGVTHTRSILLIGSSCFINDALKSDTEHDYDWLVRCQGKPEVIGSYSPAELDTACYEPVKFEHKKHFADAYRLNWKCGSSDLAFGMWTGSGGGDIALGDCPAETAAERASFLACRQRGREAHFLAALVPSKPGENVKLTRTASSLAVEINDCTDTVYFSGLSKSTESAYLQTDAHSAIVRSAKSDLVGLALISGTKLQWRGDTLLQCPTGTSFCEISLDAGSVHINYSGPAGTIRLKTNARGITLNSKPITAIYSDGYAVIAASNQAPETGAATHFLP